MDARAWWWCSGLALAAVAVAAACANPTPEDAPDPCGVLTAECPHCTQAATKETCENAVSTGDPVQCTIALDDEDVVADCVVPDGGGPPEASFDAPVLPLCDAAEVSADAGCSCVPPCVTTCPGGGCTIDCPPGATCQASCGGGGCVFQCAPRATCTDSCDGGGCAFQCQNGSVCNDTCATTPPCEGP
jgi:hypothetical protein